MATGFSIWGSSQKQQAWALDTIIEAMKASSIMKFAGDGVNNVIQKRHELQKKKGDRVYFDLFIEMSNAPITGNSELSGNEEKLTSYTDDVLINRTRAAFVKYGDLDDMYSSRSLLTIGKDILKQYFSSLVNEYCIRWLEGDSSLTWPETAGQPTTGRILYGGDATGSDDMGSSDIASGDWLGTAEVSRAKYNAVQADPKFRPLNIEGGKYFTECGTVLSCMKTSIF
jgi:hypothetical protein